LRFEIVAISSPVQRRHAIGLRRIQIGVLFEQRVDGGAV